MNTPKNYKEDLERGFITEELVDDVLFSFSKRAKNYRDQARKYRQYRYDRYNNVEHCEEKMEMLYKKKSDILGHCQDNLKAIHRLITSSRVRIYDYEADYDDYQDDIQNFEIGKRSRVVWQNFFWDNDMKEYVFFIDVIKPNSMYFLYYEFPKHSYHSPIDDDDVKLYENLQVIDLKELVTYGENINELLPLPFCNKVWNVIRNNEKFVLAGKPRPD